MVASGFIAKYFHFNGITVVGDEFGKINNMGMNVLKAKEGVNLESRGREWGKKVEDGCTVLRLAESPKGNALVIRARVTLVVMDAAGSAARLVGRASWGHGDYGVESEVQVLVASTSCFGRMDPGALVEPFGLLISLEQVW